MVQTNQRAEKKEIREQRKAYQQLRCLLQDQHVTGKVGKEGTFLASATDCKRSCRLRENVQLVQLSSEVNFPGLKLPQDV